jgi:hypothetical protein
MTDYRGVHEREVVATLTAADDGEAMEQWAALPEASTAGCTLLEGERFVAMIGFPPRVSRSRR